MSKINVQFHAEPNETITFIKDCVKDYNLKVVLIEVQPTFNAKFIDTPEDIMGMLSTCNTNRICLCINEPTIQANSYLELVDRNPNCLLITIGKYCDNKLEESVFATKTDNPDALKVWKKIVKKLNSLTLAGAWVVNPNNGAKSFYKQHRYTEKVKKLFEDGIKIVPAVGWNYYTFSE